MKKLWEGLELLRAIIDTARAEEIDEVPETIRTRYEPYAKTYFALESVKRMKERVLNELRQKHSVTGYISADYGYGKTAAAVYLWKSLMDDKVVAVPPFLFRQLKDVMLATKGWLFYELRSHPELRQTLEDLYRKHQSRSAEDLAKEIAKQKSIPEAKALDIVQEYITTRQDITTSHTLLDFLRECTELSIQAGFKGLVVFADESQEFLRTEERAREAIQTLSELVKGIRALAGTPLGFILTMPVTPTEAAIQEQADDIMDRLRERGTSLRLEDAYGREFPAQLWKYLCELYGTPEGETAVEERTLTALGQLCERKDLSNGPRTVITAFKRVGQHYQSARREYTPIDLIDDYLQEHIVFEGRGEKLTGTVRQLLELPAARESEQRIMAVKLLAAFPRGVNEQIGGELYSVIVDELAEKSGWLGEHITQLSEGYALVRLQERAEARPILDEIIRDFRRKWHQVWGSDKKALLAASAFITEIVPLLFPKRAQGQAVNFTYQTEEPETHGRGVAYFILEGSYEGLQTRFPERTVCVAVSTETEALKQFQPPKDVDLDFRFFLGIHDQDRQRVDALRTRLVSPNKDRRIDFYLNLSRTFERQFPADLQFLHDIMSPEHTSAQVLLGLSMRMMGWLKDHPETSQADKQMIEAQRSQLHRFALQLLFPDASDPAKVEAQGIAVSGAEQRLVQSAFETKCAELYPNYKPLRITRNWSTTYLRNYRVALQKRPLAERRGREPFNDSKESIAAAFGWAHSAFESNARTLQDMELLTFSWGPGRGASSEASVTFREHPLEKLIRDTIQREGKEKTVSVGARQRRVKNLEISRIKDVARREGYLSEEVDEAVELAILRQHLQRESDGTIQEFAGALDADELQQQAKELQDRLNKIAPYYGEELKEYKKGLDEAQERLTNSHDEVALDAAHRKMEEVRIRLEEFVKAKGNEVRRRTEELEQRAEQLRFRTEPRELEEAITGSVGFERHVNDQRQKIQVEYRKLRTRLETLSQKLRQLRTQADSLDNSEDTLCSVLEDCERVKDELQQVKDEIDSLQPYLAGVQHWREVVAKASLLRERLEPDNSLRQRLDHQIADAVMETFAVRQREALRDWERFKADIESVQTELEAEEKRQRDQFLGLKEAYEEFLGKLTPQRMLQATFDPKDAEQSYQVLYNAVMDKIRGWLSEKMEQARRVMSEIDYLAQERNIDTGELVRDARMAIDIFQKSQQDLNYDLVRDKETFSDYVEKLGTADDQLQKAEKDLERLRTQKGEPTEEEALLLQVQTAQKRSLEEIRRSCRERGEQLSLDDLFDRLKGLYRKGHIEIEIRKRE